MGQCDGRAWSNMAQKADSAIWCDEPGNTTAIETRQAIYFSRSFRVLDNVLELNAQDIPFVNTVM